jgi:L-asparaginase / beta-aspartyl-peptidase
VVVLHAGAGARSVELMERDDVRAAVLEAADVARAVLEGGRSAVDAAQSAIMFMEAGADLLNAGRGSVLCADGSVEMSAALMWGVDRAVGAVAGVKRTKQPIIAARTVLGQSSHVLLVGAAADAHAAASGAEMKEPGERARSRPRGSDSATTRGESSDLTLARLGLRETSLGVRCKDRQ